MSDQPMNCPICNSYPYEIGFNVEYAKSGKDIRKQSYIEHIVPLRSLKFGYLHRCPINKQYWYCDDDGLFMYRVEPDKEEFLFSWNEMALVLSENQRVALAEIGGTLENIYGSGKDEVRIPCATISDSGETIDPCMVLVTKHPPIDRVENRIELDLKGRVFVPSEYALPKNVRLATLRAEEIRMGYAPTRVQSKAGDPYILNWRPSFFRFGSIKGIDINLAEDKFDLYGSVPIVDEDFLWITTLYVDWYEDFRELEIGAA